jgi:hypothetical protein
MGFSVTDEGGLRPFVIHNARVWLYRSQDALDAGYLIEAGALLLEGIRIFLTADAEYWGVLPRDGRPASLAKALRKAGKLEGDAYPWIGGIIGLCKQTLRCQRLHEGEIETALRIMHDFCNGTTYLIEADQRGRLG